MLIRAAVGEQDNSSLCMLHASMTKLSLSEGGKGVVCSSALGLSGDLGWQDLPLWILTREHVHLFPSDPAWVVYFTTIRFAPVSAWAHNRFLGLFIANHVLRHPSHASRSVFCAAVVFLGSSSQECLVLCLTTWMLIINHHLHMALT